MSHYNVGDKFIIEIDRTYASERHKVSRYGIKGFSTLIFDENGLKRLKRYEQPMVSFYKEEDFHAAINEAYERGIKEGAELAAMHGSDATSRQLEKAYFDGAEIGAVRAWEVAKKVYSVYSPEELVEMFGEEAIEDNAVFFEKYSALDAMNIINEYEKQKSYEKEIKKRIDNGEAECDYCEYSDNEEWEEPCSKCSHNYVNQFKIMNISKWQSERST